MSILNPSDLQELCKEFCEEKPVLKEIKFKLNGVERSANIYVRQLSYADTAAIDEAYIWEKDPEDSELLKFKGVNRKALQAAQLLGTICIDEEGTSFFSDLDQALKTHPNVAQAMYVVADEVNNFWGKLKTEISVETKSGQNLSSTELADEQLQKPSETLVTESLDSGVLTEVSEEP